MRQKNRNRGTRYDDSERVMDPDEGSRVHGRIRSFWKYTDRGIRYEIDTPVRAEIVIGGKSRTVEKGRYLF